MEVHPWHGAEGGIQDWWARGEEFWRNWMGRMHDILTLAISRCPTLPLRLQLFFFLRLVRCRELNLSQSAYRILVGAHVSWRLAAERRQSTPTGSPAWTRNMWPLPGLALRPYVKRLPDAEEAGGFLFVSFATKHHQVRVVHQEVVFSEIILESLQ